MPIIDLIWFKSEPNLISSNEVSDMRSFRTGLSPDSFQYACCTRLGGIRCIGTYPPISKRDYSPTLRLAHMDWALFIS